MVKHRAEPMGLIANSPGVLPMRGERRVAERSKGAAAQLGSWAAGYRNVGRKAEIFEIFSSVH